ncbi:MAG: BON domain-containing protein [Planctomycetales bacterium]
MPTSREMVVACAFPPTGIEHAEGGTRAEFADYEAHSAVKAMISTYAGSRTKKAPQSEIWSCDMRIEASAFEALQSSGYPVLRSVRCEVSGGVVLLSGSVPSYFMKQMAQAAVMRIDGIRGVENRLDVCVARGT